jgi:hypothetical protein
MNCTPNLPQNWTTTGFLYTADNPAALGEDMFAASLPDGTTIEAGWSEEGDPQGSYLIRVTSGFDELRPPYRTNDLHDAVRRIEQTATEFVAEPPRNRPTQNNSPIGAPRSIT